MVLHPICSGHDESEQGVDLQYVDSGLHLWKFDTYFVCKPVCLTVALCPGPLCAGMCV